MKKYITSLLIFTLVFSSCSNSETITEEFIDYDKLNEEEIQKYITENNLNPEKSSTGLYYIITDEGTGESPTLSSNVTVYYKGYTPEQGQEYPFDESPTEGIEFYLQNLIKGFSEGVTYLKEGGEATLIIPSKLAYTSDLIYNPFAGKVLIFDIKLISVNE